MAQGSKATKEDSSLSPYDDTATGASSVYPTTPTKGKGKKPKLAKAPTMDEILEKAKTDENFWEQRNTRFVEHQDLFNLKEKTPPEGEILAYMNDPKVLIEKLAGMVGRRLPRIQAVARDDSMLDVAQRIENGVRQWENSLRLQRFANIHNPLDYDRAQSLFLRGWLCERLTINPDSEMLIDDVLVEPHNVYPRLAGQTIKHVSHIFDTTVEDLMESFPETAKRWEGEKPTKIVQCISYYSNKAPYWHAVVAEGDWVKKPAALEYFPWVIAIAKGAITHSPIGEVQPEDHAAYIGSGFLDSISGVYKLTNKFITMLSNTVAKQENPPKIVHTVDGKPKVVDLGTGGTSWLMSAEKLELLEVGPKIGQLMPLLSSLQDRMNKGGLPSAMFGEGTSLDSGFMSALLMGAAQDTIWTFITALAQFHALRYRKFLELFRDFAVDGIQIISKTKGKGKKSGRLVYSEMFTADDVIDNGTYIEVSYDDISPQDKVALGNLAAMLFREKVISAYTAREKYLGLDDSELEESRVFGDMLLMNPEFMKRAALLEWKKLGRRPELKKLVDEIEQKEMAAAQPQQQPQNVPQLPPGIDPQQAGFQAGLSGAPAANMEGAPPEAVMGLPPEVSPTGVVGDDMAPGPLANIQRLLGGQ